jgi:hypothetical protein
MHIRDPEYEKFGSGMEKFGSGMEKIRIRDLGFEINIPDPQHCLKLTTDFSTAAEPVLLSLFS